MNEYVWFGVLAGCCLGIMKACDFFEIGANYLGRNLSAGAKGALINALGSSMPELLVTLAFVLTGKPELILAGVAVTAGSAVFNAVLIPAVAIMFAGDGLGPVRSFELDRSVLMRDGIYLLLIEGLLIYMLGQPQFTLGMVLLLLAAYSQYAAHVMWDSHRSGEKREAYDYSECSGPLKAWLSLLGAMLALGILCHFLSESVIHIADTLHWSVYLAAVVFAAAATSLPDTILSVKSAKKGEYEDAVGNAIGSNIFDVTGALAIPMLIAMCISGWEPLPIVQSEGLLALRYFVLGTSAVVVASLLLCAKNINRYMSVFLFGVYAVWVGYIIFM